MQVSSNVSRNILWFAGFAISLLAGGYYIYFFFSHSSQLPKLDLSSITFLYFALTVVMYIGIIAIGSTVWFLLLRYYRQKIAWIRTQIIYGQAQFGKYIPGNIAHHIGRIILSRKSGIAAPIAVGTMLIEMVWGVATGIAVAVIFSVSVSGHALAAEHIQTKYFAAISIMVASVFLPYIALKAIKKYMPATSARLTDFGIIELPNIRTIVKIMILYILTFFIFGLVLDIHARHIFNMPDNHYLLLVGIFSWAWIAGFITPGAPAGLGVRDAVLLATLTPLYGAGVAIGLSMTLRIVTTLGDGIWFIISMLASFVARK